MIGGINPLKRRKLNTVNTSDKTSESEGILSSEIANIAHAATASDISALAKELLEDDIEGELVEASEEQREKSKNLLQKITDSLSQNKGS